MARTPAAQRLAVLITYYNEGELLRRCLDSLQRQSTSVDEIWVYDDASADPAERHVPANLPVRIVRGEANLGHPSYGRNKLLQCTGCEYVHFHDADDIFSPGWSRAVKAAIELNSPDAVFTEISSVRHGSPVSERVIGFDRAGEDFVSFSIQGVLLPASGTYRRSTVLSIGGYRADLRQSEDYEFHLRLLAANVEYSIIPEPLATIDIRDASRSTDAVACLDSIVTSIESLHSKFAARYLPDFVERLASVAVRLFRLGAYAEAERALRMAFQLGKPTFRHERPVFRTLAVLFGARKAERVASCYRRAVPQWARAWAVRRSL